MQRARNAGARKPAGKLGDQLARFVLWLLILLPPIVLDPAMKNNFRLPKELVSEVLALASILLLTLRLRRVGRLGLGATLRHPAILAVVPFVAVAGLGALVSEHPLHTARGFSSLVIAAAALVAWSLALDSEEKLRLLRAVVYPAAFLAVLAVAQTHDLFDPFQFQGRVNERRGLTSLAGGAFDLAAYLVLPALIAQIGLYTAGTARRRGAWTAALALFVYAIARTQTLTGLAALVVASAVVWAVLLPRRRVLAGAAVLVLVGAAVAAGVTPLRNRLVRSADRLAEGRVNDLLTGRLDGWRTAVRMFEKHPWLGIGTGAFTTEFAPAKLELEAEGVPFFQKHFEAHFDTAHNEFLEVAAECGILGLLALGWGFFVAGRALLRPALPRSPPDRALAFSATAALLVMATTAFPLHLALVAYPYLLVGSWILEDRTGKTEDGS